MFMKDDNKKMAAMVLDRIRKPGEQPAPTEDVDASIPLESAAEEIMQAFETKDPKALVEALKSFMELCNTEEPVESEEVPY